MGVEMVKEIYWYEDPTWRVPQWSSRESPEYCMHYGQCNTCTPDMYGEQEIEPMDDEVYMKSVYEYEGMKYSG